MDYKIKKGDTLSQVVQKHYSLKGWNNIYKKTCQVAKENNIKNPNLIFAGKTIKLNSNNQAANNKALAAAKAKMDKKYKTLNKGTNTVAVADATKVAKNKVKSGTKKIKDTKNDGKISFGEKLKSMGKGVLNTLKGMVCDKNGKFSIKKTLVTVAVAAAATAITVATGGAAAPALVAIGATLGAVQLGKGVINATKAKTDNQAKQAWADIGSGTFVVAASVIGAKGALKTAGVSNAAKMSPLRATAECFKVTPKMANNSYNLLRSGEALANLKSSTGALIPEKLNQRINQVEGLKTVSNRRANLGVVRPELQKYKVVRKNTADYAKELIVDFSNQRKSQSYLPEYNGQFWCYPINRPKYQHCAWKMHINSQNVDDWQQVSSVVLPYLRDKQILHKTINPKMFAELNANVVQKGKAFTAYFRSEEEFRTAATDLAYIFKRNNLETNYGNILGDRLLPNSGGRIFYRYEFNSGKYRSSLSNEASYDAACTRTELPQHLQYLAKDMTEADDPFLNFIP